MPDLLAFGRGEAQRARISTASRALSTAQQQLGWAGAVGNALTSLLTGLALWGILWLAIPLVGSKIDGISLAVLILITLSSFEAIAPLTQAAQHLGSTLQAARRLFQLVDVPPEVAAPPDPGHLEAGLPAIRVHGLTFCYPGSRQPALVNFDLELPPGKHIALVGPSGSGKTTFFNLLMRFWEYENGKIELNGRDLRGFDPEAVRSRMAIISQSTYLFAGTVRQNLLLARPEAAQADLDQAVFQAQLAEWITQLPQGLDTWIGERGLQISGGERQRISIARALLRSAPLFLLDEPTANLDANTEQRLLETIRQVTRGRSAVYITHRLVGLEELDEILVLQGGRVIERGEHAELLALGGLYAQMHQIQREEIQ